MNAEKRKHIIMFDSRGNGLQTEIEKIKPDIPVEAWFFGGANYERLKDEADYYAKNRPFDIIYIVGGVNELTKKDTYTRKYYFRWENYENLEHHMLERLAGPTKKKWRSDREANRGKSRQNSANFVLKKWRSLFKKIATDRIAEGIPENNGDHFGGEI